MRFLRKKGVNFIPPILLTLNVIKVNSVIVLALNVIKVLSVINFGPKRNKSPNNSRITSGPKLVESNHND